MPEVKPKGVNSIQKGHYVVVDGAVCVVLDLQSSKAGKHGHAKVRMEVVGILDGKKRNIVMPSAGTIDTPVVDKRNAQVLSISGETVSVMDSENYETFEMKIPEEYKEQIKEGTLVLYWDVMGDRVIKGIKGNVESGEQSW